MICRLIGNWWFTVFELSSELTVSLGNVNIRYAVTNVYEVIFSMNLYRNALANGWFAIIDYEIIRQPIKLQTRRVTSRAPIVPLCATVFNVLHAIWWCPINKSNTLFRGIIYIHVRIQTFETFCLTIFNFFYA